MYKNTLAYLHLHLEVTLEGGEECYEDRQAHFKHLGDTGHSVLGQGNTEELFDGSDEDFVSTEDGTRVLQDGEEKL